jgi:CubicO group peptidase (beta-lactamase class C family)
LDEDVDDMHARIDDLFAPWARADSPGCAVGVMRDGEIVHLAGYGMANLEHDIPIEPSSIFHAASITKQFTATCVLMLATEGRLSLDDDVRSYVPELPDYGSPITIRHLLHHISGLRDQWDLLHLSGWRRDDLVTEQDVLDVAARQRHLNFAPGEQHLYSNTGYTLLAVIVRRASGMSLRRFAHERIFAPLGMTRTHLHDDHAEIVPGRTQAYADREDGGFTISVPVFDVVGTTSLFTTVEDLLKWSRNFEDGAFGGSRVLDQLHQRGRLNDGSPIAYAMGVQHSRYRGLKVVEHSGGDAGYRAHLLRIPDKRVAVACLCNLASIKPRELALAIVDICLDGQLEPPEDVEGNSENAAMPGIYRDPQTGDLRRVVEHEGEYSTGFFELKPLHPVRAGVWSIEDDPFTRLRFESTKGAAALAVDMLYSEDRPRRLEHIANAHHSMPRPADVSGTFRSDELDVTWQLDGTGEWLSIRRWKFDDWKMLPAGTDLFAGDGRRLEVDRNAEGAVVTVRFSTNRVRDVEFRRV